MAENKINQTLNDEIIELFEKVDSWEIPFQMQFPKNLMSKKNYRGYNVPKLMLYNSVKGYSSPYFVTYAQAKKLGGFVKKGEKGTHVVFWKIIKKTEINDEGKEIKTAFPLLRYYSVFNVEQCENLESKIPITQVNENDKIQIIEEFIKSYSESPKIQNGLKACYIPKLDIIEMPDIKKWNDAEKYYSGLFHELVHSTGHNDRLNRLNGTILFGNHDYSKEELVAELGAVYLCSHFGIKKTTINNSASYLKHWLSIFKGDIKFFLNASQRAQKAFDYILENSKSD